MKKEILNIALQNVKKEVPLELLYNPEEKLDEVITIIYKNQQFHFVLELRKEVRQYLIAQLEEKSRQNKHVLLVAERIPTKVKEALREKKIAYMEANGNMYLERDHVYLLIDTKKPIQITKEKGNRAFTKTGLKVLLHFLIKQDLVNQTQREIAEYTGVGLGNIPQIIEGLKATGYLIPLNKKEYIWENRKELLHRWIEGYQTILKPTLKNKRYQMRVPWQEIQLNEGIAVWGGEAAADLLTNYLRPENFILYTNEVQANLIRNYKLQPKQDGHLEVVELFWNNEFNQGTAAPAIIIYAELLLEGGKRNNETAEMILNEYIQQNL